MDHCNTLFSYIEQQTDSNIQICFQIVVLNICLYGLLEQIYTVADREEIELCAPIPKYLNKYYDQKTVSFNDLSEELGLLRSKVSHLSFHALLFKHVSKVPWHKILYLRTVHFFCAVRCINNSFAE